MTYIHIYKYIYIHLSYEPSNLTNGTPCTRPFGDIQNHAQLQFCVKGTNKHFLTIPHVTMIACQYKTCPNQPTIYQYI